MVQPAESCKGSGSCRLLGDEDTSTVMSSTSQSAGAKNCQLVRIQEVAVVAIVGCWALGGRG